MSSELLEGVALACAGGLVMVLATSSAYRIGRSVTNMECQQLRSTTREMIGSRGEARRQIAAVDEQLSRLALDPRTHPHMKLELEKLREFTTRRDRSDHG